MTTGSAPCYLLALDGHDTTGLSDRLGALGPLRTVPSVEALLAGGEGGGRPPPGWVFLPPGTGAEVVETLLVRLAAVGGGWSPLLVVEEDEGLSVVPLFPGFRVPLSEVVERLGSEDTGPGLLSFRLALDELSRIRHDVNNPLTAAIAEVQLLLMDVEPDSETEDALKVVESQLRRIRDLVAELTVFRAPKMEGAATFPES